MRGVNNNNIRVHYAINRYRHRDGVISSNFRNNVAAIPRHHISATIHRSIMFPIRSIALTVRFLSTIAAQFAPHHRLSRVIGPRHRLPLIIAATIISQFAASHLSPVPAWPDGGYRHIAANRTGQGCVHYQHFRFAYFHATIAIPRYQYRSIIRSPLQSIDPLRATITITYGRSTPR